VGETFERRIGRFEIPTELVEENAEELLTVMATVVVLRCEHRFATKAFLYDAWSPQFDVLDPGAEPPEYDAVIDTDAGSVTWQRKAA
jgi:hypothetical protein